MGEIFCYEDLRLKDLKLLARGFKVPGSHEMVKAQLVPILSQLDPDGNCAKANSAIRKSSRAESVKHQFSSESKIVSPLPKSEQVQPAVDATVSVKKSSLSVSSKEKKPVSLSQSVPSEPSAVKKSSLSGSSVSESVVKPKIVRSRLNVSPQPPIKPTEGSSEDQKKTRKRRSVIPKRENARPISPMPGSSQESAEISLHQNEPNRAEFLKEKLLSRKTLETPSSGVNGRDRIVLQVCGPFWLHAWWEISGNLVSRVRAAMGHLWHTADPVIRLYRVRYDNAGGRYTEFVSDSVIRGGVYNWFLCVDNPPDTFLVEIGYRSRDSQFFSLVSSNTVETPHNYIQESMGWSESGWNMLTASTRVSPFENGEPAVSESAVKFSAAESPRGNSFNRRFGLSVDAEVVIKGRTNPDAQLTIRGERIWLREDGSFLIRYHLPDRRHVFPVMAVSRDGIDTKTIVLSVERNTKNLETVVRSQNEED